MKSLMVYKSGDYSIESNRKDLALMTKPISVKEPIISPDGNFFWDGHQWIPISTKIEPLHQPISSGIYAIEHPNQPQSFGESLKYMGMCPKKWGKSSFEIRGIQQSSSGLTQLFQSGLIQTISQDMELVESRNDCLKFRKTGIQTVLHLDVFMIADKELDNGEVITNLRVEMYVRGKKIRKKDPDWVKEITWRVHPLDGKMPLQRSVGLAMWKGNSKLLKLEKDLLEILK